MTINCLANFITKTGLVALILSGGPFSYAESGATYHQLYLLDQRTQQLANRDKDARLDAMLAQIKASEQKAIAKQKQFQDLLDIYEPNYKTDDPVCHEYRVKEIELHREKVRTDLERDYRIHDNILNICKQTNYDTYTNYVGRFIDGVKSILPFTDQDLRLSERFKNKGLRQESYEILTYPKLKDVLAKECFPGQPDMRERFKLNVVEDDLVPTSLGTYASLSLFTFLGPIVKAAVTPVSATAKATTAISWSYKVIVGAVIAIPTFGYFTIKRDEFQKIEAENEFTNSKNVEDAEILFPEVDLEDIAQECIQAELDAIESSNFKGIAKLKCQQYINHISTALKWLRENDQTRCHPANKDAETRIHNQLEQILSRWPELNDYVTQKLGAQY